MSTARLIAPRWLPPLVGIGSGVLFLAAIELLVRSGAINRFIVPLPSEVIASFARVIADEDIPHRSRRRHGNALPRAFCSPCSASRSAR